MSGYSLHSVLRCSTRSPRWLYYGSNPSLAGKKNPANCSSRNDAAALAEGDSAALVGDGLAVASATSTDDAGSPQQRWKTRSGQTVICVS